MKKFKNVVTSVEDSAAPVVDEVLDMKILGASEVNGVVSLNLSVDFPVGRSQQQQKYSGTNDAWVDVGAALVFDAPTTFGTKLPLNANTAVQYVFRGA